MDVKEIDPGSKFKVDDAAATMDEVLDDAPTEEVDPASYRDLTKEEVLDGVAEGVRDLLAGNFRPADDCYDELGWQLADD